MTETEASFTQIRLERPSERIARIVLARADKRNAQNMQMLYEINAALDIATQDDQVRVIILAADGPDFSSGHDLTDKSSEVGDYGAPVTGTGGFGLAGQEGYFAREQEVFLGFCWRWRNLPKPVIVAVQGRAIAGGLMLIWPFDIIIASDDASFADPVVAFGANGHEFFVHAWEVGHRKAKEMLFTGEPVSAQEAKELGMVNQVVPRERLESYTLEMAEKIAQRPMIGLRMSKLSVNQSLDAQGMWTAIQSAFGLHHFAHAHNQLMHGMIVDPAGMQIIRDQARKKTSN
jgi:enoyl-CoA hydratase